MKYLLNAGVEWDIPMVRGVTLTGRFVHTGEQQVKTANTLELPAWSRLDLGARYVLAIGEQPLTLRATVDNVTNERYWASAFDSFAAALLQGDAPHVQTADLLRLLSGAAYARVYWHWSHPTLSRSVGFQPHVERHG